MRRSLSTKLNCRTPGIHNKIYDTFGHKTTRQCRPLVLMPPIFNSRTIYSILVVTYINNELWQQEEI